MPVPEPPEKYTLDSEPEFKETSPGAGTSTKEDQDFSLYSTTEPHLVTQAELNDLVRDLDFPKTKAQLLRSRLRQCHLLRKGCESFIGRGSRTLQSNFRWTAFWYTATTPVILNFIPVTNLMHKFLYSYKVTVLYMFQAVLCSSSGGQIVCIQHVVVVVVKYTPVYCTTTTATPPEDEHNTARNM